MTTGAAHRADVDAAEHEAIAEQVYEAYRLGRMAARAEHLPMWHEPESRAHVPSVEIARALDAVEKILAARTEQDAPSPEAEAYEAARRRLRHLHTSLAGQRQDWANSDRPCSAARAVAYQGVMASVHSIIDEIEAIAGGGRRG